MLNHLLPQLVSFSSPPPLLSLRSLLPSYTLFIRTSVMFFPFTPVFLQILPFLSQETMNLPFLPHLVISSRHTLLIEQCRTAESRRFKNRISHFKFRFKTRTENIHHASCCGLVLREPKRDCSTNGGGVADTSHVSSSKYGGGPFLASSGYTFCARTCKQVTLVIAGAR